MSGPDLGIISKYSGGLLVSNFARRLQVPHVSNSHTSISWLDGHGDKIVF